MIYFLIAGEQSGDLHASALIREVKKIDRNAQFIGFGGDKMKSEGMTLLAHFKSFSFMGFWEVVRNAFVFKKYLKMAKNEITKLNPDAVIFVDFSGFNLIIAKFCRKKGIKTVYYISPKLWAWRSSRINIIKACVDKMFVIFPFEVLFYQQHGMKVEYVGNPSQELIMHHQFSQVGDQKSTRRKVALFPGSRLQELKKHVPIFRNIIHINPDLDFIVSGVSHVEQMIYEPLDRYKNVKLVFSSSIQALNDAEVALITSGTATLEAGLMGVPQIVGYKTSWITYWIARLFIKTRFISLVNILAGEAIVTELIQREFNTHNTNNELQRLLNDQVLRKQMEESYIKISDDLGYKKASENVAKNLGEWLSSS